MSMHPSRRQFLQTFAFSAAALAARLPARAATVSNPSAQHYFIFGDWGAQGNTDPQRRVAEAMASYAAEQRIQPEALLLLGDNFYGHLDGGVDCDRWNTQFEAMYPPDRFAGPCYALLGNHDYNVEPAGKADAQLAYAAAHPGTRWNMPAKWYRLELPRERPMATVLMLDSNYQKPTVEKLSLTPGERAAQALWLKAELEKPRTTPFLIVCGHHPLYSNAGDGTPLIAEWDGLFRRHGVHLYFCGHIHDLEHLEFAGHPTSFVVTGGGGTTLRENQSLHSSATNQFNAGIHGFTHLEMTRERLAIRHIDENGKQLHAFAKLPQGGMEIL
jgi:hypothetical protein